MSDTYFEYERLKIKNNIYLFDFWMRQAIYFTTLLLQNIFSLEFITICNYI